MSSRFEYPFAPLMNPPASPIDFTADSPDEPYLGIYAKDSVKRYILGTRYLSWDGRVFKYAQAGATMKTDLACHSYKYQAIVQWAQFPTAHAIGANPINVTTKTTYDGSAYDGVFTKDELAGGYIVLFWGSGSTGGTYGIVGNDAVAAAGTMAIYLDHPNRYAITKATGSAEAIWSPYYDVRNASASDNRSPMVGVPMAPATTTYPYHWIQTWGPIHIATPDSSVGNDLNNHHLVFGGDGSIEDMTTDALQLRQHAGFTLAQDYNDGSPQQASPFMMLQISI